MYKIDSNDKVHELTEFPQSSVGAPIPVIIASESKVSVAFYLNNVPEDWDGSEVKIRDSDSVEPVAIVTFERCYAHYSGAPNDEAFSGHPLASRGLGPYGSYEILDSSWIRTLESMNSVHPYHDKKEFMENMRHFVLSFHDSTFECIAKDYKIHMEKGSIKDMIPKMTELTL